MKLSELHNGNKGIITKVKGRGAFRKRITEMGFVKGKEVKVIKNAPLKDPIEYNILGYDVSLRKSEASLIDVITETEVLNTFQENFNGVINEDILKTSAKEKSKLINAFQEVYQSLQNQANDDKEIFKHHKNSESSLEALSGLAQGVRLRDSFKVLVDEYLHFMPGFGDICEEFPFHTLPLSSVNSLIVDSMLMAGQ